MREERKKEKKKKISEIKSEQVRAEKINIIALVSFSHSERSQFSR